METMKYPSLSNNNMAVSGSNSVDEIDSIFSTEPCWNTSNGDDLIDHKLMLDETIGPNLDSGKALLADAMQDDANHTEFTSLFNLPTTNLAELKPLPPFSNYTAHLSINGIQGHHYHTISQRIPEENNNNYGGYAEQNIVSSSTCNVGSDSGDEKPLYSVDEVVKLGYVTDYVSADSVSSGMKFEDCSHAQIKAEMGDYVFENLDIADIIGSAMVDTTGDNNDNQTTGADIEVDFDQWMDPDCNAQKNSMVDTERSISEFLAPSTSNEYTKTSDPSVNYGTNKPIGSTLQNLLTHNNMPLLQYRLQNGPPVKQEAPSSTGNYNPDHIPTSSPPANVVSTTDNLMMTVNGRFIPQYAIHNMHDERIRSPEMLGQNYPHTTTTSTPSSTKKSRSRAQKKQQAASSTVFSSDQTLGLLGKDKPMHRCTVCNRGFLNKSNIKVHLRTHTGEKPFKCETCKKAFRQKAHLLKHQQIHKRVVRD